jgi:Fuc2NAc and GlcNAc transferase
VTTWHVLPPFLAALIGTWLVRRWSASLGLLDVPNARSLHVKVTPRGGGLAIVVATAVGIASFAPGDGRTWEWVGAGVLVAGVGLIDDLRGVQPAIRFAVHGVAAAVLIACVDPRLLPLAHLGAFAVVLAWLAAVWSINLFNFMDGSDGLAGAQAVFVFGAAASFGTFVVPTPDARVLAVCTAATAGFLVWNWPPARIFMGDVGSGFLGYLVAACALLTVRSPDGFWAWIVLHGLFVSDATVTLLVRASRGERVYAAHRTHLYQRLAQRWGSHRRVLYAAAAVNVVWLLPLAGIAYAHPAHGAAIAAIALGPLVLAAYFGGAGRPISNGS